MTEIIYHLTPADYFNSLPTDRPYLPREFDRDGFIHCTKGEEHMLLVADAIYRRVPGDFLLLAIDESKVAAPIRYENVGGIMFPHIYGPLNRDAVIRITAMGRRPDGTFLPIGAPDAHAAEAAATEAWLSQARVEQLLAESADLRARTIERLTRIERDIAALKAPVTPAPPAAQAKPVASVSAPTLEERVRRLEQEMSNIASQISKIEARQKSEQAKTRKPIARKSPARRK